MRFNRHNPLLPTTLDLDELPWRKSVWFSLGLASYGFVMGWCLAVAAFVPHLAR